MFTEISMKFLMLSLSDDSDIALDRESDVDSDWEYESGVEEHFEPPSQSLMPARYQPEDAENAEERDRTVNKMKSKKQQRNLRYKMIHLPAVVTMSHLQDFSNVVLPQTTMVDRGFGRAS